MTSDRAATPQETPLEADLVKVTLATLATLPAAEVLQILGPYLRQRIGMDDSPEAELVDLRAKLRESRRALKIESARFASVLALIRTDVRSYDVPESCEGVRCDEEAAAHACAAWVPPAAASTGALDIALVGASILTAYLANAEERVLQEQRRADLLGLDRNKARRALRDGAEERAKGWRAAREARAEVARLVEVAAELRRQLAAMEFRATTAEGEALKAMALSEDLTTQLQEAEASRREVARLGAAREKVASDRAAAAEKARAAPASSVAFQLAIQRSGELETERAQMIKALEEAAMKITVAEERATRAEAELAALDGEAPAAPPIKLRARRTKAPKAEATTAPAPKARHRKMGRPKLPDDQVSARTLANRERERRKAEKAAGATFPEVSRAVPSPAPPPAPQRGAASSSPGPLPVAARAVAPPAPVVKVALPAGSLVQITVQKKAEPAFALPPPVAPELVTNLESRVYCDTMHANIAAKTCVMNLEFLKAGKGVKGKNTSALHQARTFARSAEKCVTCTSGPRVVARLEQLVKIKSKPIAAA